MHSFSVPLGAALGKSLPRTSLIRKAPPAYGVPAAAGHRGGGEKGECLKVLWALTSLEASA